MHALPGTAMASLNYMDTYLAKVPSSFPTLEKAIQWTYVPSFSSAAQRVDVTHSTYHLIPFYIPQQRSKRVSPQSRLGAGLGPATARARRVDRPLRLVRTVASLTVPPRPRLTATHA
jgi:hypothetical protein